MTIIQPVNAWYEDDYTPHYGQVGSAYAVGSDVDCDVIDELHATVEEATGWRPERPERRIGFY